MDTDVSGGIDQAQMEAAFFGRGHVVAAGGQASMNGWGQAAAAMDKRNEQQC